MLSDIIAVITGTLYSLYEITQSTWQVEKAYEYVEQINLLSLSIAYSDWSVAVPTTRRHSVRSFAFRQAVWTPKFIGLTSSAITRSQVKLGLPGGRFQDRGGFCIAAQTARRWSSVDCARAMWPKKRNLLARTVSETDRHCVTCLISALVCVSTGSGNCLNCPIQTWSHGDRPQTIVRAGSGEKEVPYEPLLLSLFLYCLILWNLFIVSNPFKCW